MGVGVLGPVLTICLSCFGLLCQGFRRDFSALRVLPHLSRVSPTPPSEADAEQDDTAAIWDDGLLRANQVPCIRAFSPFAQLDYGLKE